MAVITSTSGKDYLLAEKELRLQVPRRSNSKRAREPWLEIHKSLVRKYIERDDWRDC